MSALKYNEIKLANERNEHVSKRLNRLSTWKFFTVLYRDQMLKILLSNILLLIFFLPAVVVFYFNTLDVAQITNILPSANALGMGASVWTGVTDYVSGQSLIISNEYHLWLIPALAALAFTLSGGFAIIRDAFWTGRLTIFKSFWLGIKGSIAYSLICSSLLSVAYYGIYSLQSFLLSSVGFPKAVSIIFIVLAYLLLFFAGMYCFILISVAATYKQDAKTNLKDAWLLMWMNILPNSFKLIIALIPVVVLALINLSSSITSFILVIMLFIGAFYIVLVWMTHMMKTFALFHPVTKKEKN